MAAATTGGATGGATLLQCTDDRSTTLAGWSMGGAHNSLTTPTLWQYPDYKLNPGAVEPIFEQPEQPNHILTGYNRGLIVLWNRGDNTFLKTFASNQQLEALCWHQDCRTFTSLHNDGKSSECP
jgi:hypothetical protein